MDFRRFQCVHTGGVKQKKRSIWKGERILHKSKMILHFIGNYQQLKTHWKEESSRILLPEFCRNTQKKHNQSTNAHKTTKNISRQISRYIYSSTEKISAYLFASNKNSTIQRERVYLVGDKKSADF
eukprot:GEMP01054774.1.p1 GENE.GEMP01054774.1~~GEMP01054774.1.p1  ORF type:complete len:126 (-),score=0.61 GEMP01054774.1:152-529(-)